MEKVADVLARKYPQFNTVSPDHLISDALYQMCAESVDFLIVLDGDSFLGILTSSDIANKVLFTNRQLNEVRVKEFMNRNLPVATLDDSIEYCMQLLERHNAKYLVVYDQFTFKGVVSSYDLMQEALYKRNTVFEGAAPSDQTSWNY
jgi:predicted transcriptional regulator